MFKFLKDRKKKDNKGFTLVELVRNRYPCNFGWITCTAIYKICREIKKISRCKQYG